ncbi:MAG: ABC transporter ATP-binding protein [Alphaproteobacteria bacterium]|nr:ABC transporter ATP-binding protein [Alphaproteobacteria bacterium]MDE2112993.1 ABC transporter ATP-binding protein [Alphaproteobacteria bacterium]MDE2492481.1 ABC transporter ATP-binding protein [Alphaproteobacteria bacterium]
MAVSSDEPVIRLRGVVNRVGGRLLHDHVDLDVYRGEILAVVGGSGTGKSVLLRSIVGLMRPAEGSIEVLGRNVMHLSESGLRALQMRWGVLFQDGALFSSQTVAENIQVPLREYTTMSQRLMNEIAAMKLSMVGLPEDAAQKRPSELSGGMRKRAGLARALALEPELVFLDEPTAGLDPISANLFDELVRGLQESLNLTVFMVTHDLDTLKATADRVAVLVNKQLKIGTVETLRNDSDPWIQEYFSGPRGRAALAS